MSDLEVSPPSSPERSQPRYLQRAFWRAVLELDPGKDHSDNFYYACYLVYCFSRGLDVLGDAEDEKRAEACLPLIERILGIKEK